MIAEHALRGKQNTFSVSRIQDGIYPTLGAGYRALRQQNLTANGSASDTRQLVDGTDMHIHLSIVRKLYGLGNCVGRHAIESSVTLHAVAASQPTGT